MLIAVEYDGEHHQRNRDQYVWDEQRLRLIRGVRAAREHRVRQPGWCTRARDGDGGWRIRDQAGAERGFDLLVVANGHHWDPRLAEFPGTF
ncbi:hypothetical protein H7I76_30830, partial [Mycolicibacterium vaccae]|nr:hypothetical protein [Mycolicibacterium vaccae]